MPSPVLSEFPLNPRRVGSQPLTLRVVPVSQRLPLVRYRWHLRPIPTHAGPDQISTSPESSCGLAIVTTVAAVGLSLKQGSSVQRDRDGHSDISLYVADGAASVWLHALRDPSKAALSNA
jgi:hypothetical protein